MCYALTRRVQNKAKFRICTNVVESIRPRSVAPLHEHYDSLPVPLHSLERPKHSPNSFQVVESIWPRSVAPLHDQHDSLPVPLHSLEGPKRSLKRLQAVLREVESGERESQSVSSLCGQLKNSGYTQDYLAQQIRNYLAGESRNQVLEALDLRLLACHHVLLEDLSEDLLEELLEKQLADDELSRVRKQLYGDSSLPVLTSEARQKRVISSVEEKNSTKRRQLIIERIAVDAALREYRESQRQQEGSGRGSIGSQRLWKAWVNDLTQILMDPQSSYARGRGAKSFKALQKLCGTLESQGPEMDPQVLALIACQTTLNLLFLPNYRHKDDAQRDVQDGRFGEVRWVTVCSTIGEMVQMERMAMDSTSLKGDRDRRNMMFRRLRKAASQDVVKTVQLGAALAELLLSCAKVEVPAEQVPEKFNAENPPKPGQKVLLEALQHRLRREGKRKHVGVISLHPAVRSMLESDEDLMRFIQPKHKPMIIPPDPWRPCGLGPQGPYLIHPVEFVRTTDQKMTCLRSYNPTRVACVMDFLGRMPWKINRRILDLMEHVKSEDLAVADVPQQKDPEVPPLPTTHEELILSDQELKEMRMRHFNARKVVQTLQSERPTFDLKLQVAKEFLNAEQVYFPQNVDFRGRSYPIPPHLNHIGDDVSRGLLMFAEGKALGPDGLFWLKVNLANLFGKNKVSLADRAAWVDAQKETILQVAKDPLNEENIKWWSSADDGPWQALARCFELEEVWSSSAPEEYKSYLPVHMDGSCNGLQHYAALGRDIEGGQAVNLVPAEKPQDVYTFVLNVVKKKVHAQATAELEEESTDSGRYATEERKKQLAQRLIELDVLQRKVVKQTVMTICYGVTNIGAFRQVQSHMGDFVGDKVETAELKELSRYLSGLVLASIGDVFAGAKKIQDWFKLVTKMFNGVQAPVAWISPLGFSCSQPYRKAETVRMASKRQSITLKTGEQPIMDKGRQSSGFPPNFVHSLDATHMMMVAERCQKQGIYFAAVHDSFWTHASDVPLLNESIREAFVELYEKPVLQEVYEDFCVHLGGQKVPPLPEPGKLDISVVKNSTYLFS